MQYYKLYFGNNECIIELPDNVSKEQIVKIFKEWREMSAFMSGQKINIHYI